MSRQEKIPGRLRPGRGLRFSGTGSSSEEAGGGSNVRGSCGAGASSLSANRESFRRRGGSWARLLAPAGSHRPLGMALGCGRRPQGAVLLLLSVARGVAGHAGLMSLHPGPGALSEEPRRAAEGEPPFPGASNPPRVGPLAQEPSPGLTRSALSKARRLPSAGFDKGQRLAGGRPLWSRAGRISSLTLRHGPLASPCLGPRQSSDGLGLPVPLKVPQGQAPFSPLPNQLLARKRWWPGRSGLARGPGEGLPKGRPRGIPLGLQKRSALAFLRVPVCRLRTAPPALAGVPPSCCNTSSSTPFPAGVGPQPTGGAPAGVSAGRWLPKGLPGGS